MKRGLAILLMVIMCLAGMPCKVWASSNTVTIGVGKTKTLYTNYTGSGTLISAMWTSNCPEVSIESECARSCVIKANKYTDLPVVVDCEYFYKVASKVGGRTYYHTLTGYTSYTVKVEGSGDSGSDSGSDYSLSASKSVMNIDMIGSNSQMLTLTSGVTLSDDVYIRNNSASGNRVTVVCIEKSGKKATYRVETTNTGTQYVKFELIQKTGKNSTSIRDKVTVRFNITCSHSYDKGKVTKEATEEHTGVMTYTCIQCKATKTETIPKLEPSDTDSDDEDHSDEDSDSGDDNSDDTSRDDNSDDTSEDDDSDDTSEDNNDQDDGNGDNGESEDNTNKNGVTGVTVSEESVELDQRESKKIQMHVQTNADCTYTYKLEQNGDAFTTRDNNDGSFTLYGDHAGEGTLHIYILDYETREKLAETAVQVKVNASEANTEATRKMGDISIDVDSIEVKVGETKNIELTIYQGVPIDCCYGCSYSCGHSAGFLKTEFKSGTDAEHYTLAITGNECESGNLEIYVQNYKTKEYISKVIVPVTVIS